MENVLWPWWPGLGISGSQRTPFWPQGDYDSYGAEAGLPVVAPGGDVELLWSGLGDLTYREKKDLEEGPFLKQLYGQLPTNVRRSLKTQSNRFLFAERMRSQFISYKVGSSDGNDFGRIGGVNYLPSRKLRVLLSDELKSRTGRRLKRVDAPEWLPRHLVGNALWAKSTEEILFSPTGAVMDVSAVKLQGDPSWLVSPDEVGIQENLHISNASGLYDIARRTVLPSERILQLQGTTLGGGDVLYAAARSTHSVEVFKKNTGSNDDDSKMKHLASVILGTKEFSLQTIAISEHMPGEVAVLRGDGSFHLVRVVEELREVMRVNQDPKYIRDLPDIDVNSWRSAVYGAHPRQVFVADEERVWRVDLEVGKHVPLFKLKDWNLPRGALGESRFNAMERHPTNPFHLVFATDHLTILTDTRYLRTPILSWDMRPQPYPVRLLSITSLPDLEVVLALTTSRNTDLSCMAYRTPPQPHSTSPFPPPPFISTGPPLSHLPAVVDPIGLAVIPAIQPKRLIALQANSDGGLIAQALATDNGRRREVPYKEGPPRPRPDPTTLLRRSRSPEPVHLRTRRALLPQKPVPRDFPP